MGDHIIWSIDEEEIAEFIDEMGYTILDTVTDMDAWNIAERMQEFVPVSDPIWEAIKDYFGDRLIDNEEV